MDNRILLITPPDKVFNQNKSCLLIYPSSEVKDQAQQILLSSEEGQKNIYLYNIKDKNDHDIDWLLTVAKMSDIVILDLDNCEQEVKALSSYLISLPHTFWLTKEDKWQYNKLSTNRIYGLDAIEHLLIGGRIET